MMKLITYPWWGRYVNVGAYRFLVNLIINNGLQLHNSIMQAHNIGLNKQIHLQICVLYCRLLIFFKINFLKHEANMQT